MNQENCPKCTTGIFYATNIFDNSLHLPKSQESFLGLPGIVREPVAIRTMVCVNCGYLEAYVVDHEFLKRVPQSNAWIKV